MRPQCSVCLENMQPWEDNKLLSALHCGHVYHEDCITEWLADGGRKICPQCCGHVRTEEVRRLFFSQPLEDSIFIPESLKEQLQEKDQEMTSLTAQLLTLRNSVELLNASIEDMRSQIFNKHVENINLKTEVKNLKKQTGDISKLRDAAVESEQKNKVELKAARSSYDRVLGLYLDLTPQIKELESKLKSAELRNKEVEKDMRDLQKKLEKAVLRADGHCKQFGDDVQGLVHKLHSDLKDFDSLKAPIAGPVATARRTLITKREPQPAISRTSSNPGRSESFNGRTNRLLPSTASPAVELPKRNTGAVPNKTTGAVVIRRSAAVVTRRNTGAVPKRVPSARHAPAEDTSSNVLPAKRTKSAVSNSSL